MSHRGNLVARILLPVIAISLLAGCIQSPGGIAPSNIPLEGRSYRNLTGLPGYICNIFTVYIGPLRSWGARRYAGHSNMDPFTCTWQDTIVILPDAKSFSHG